MYRLARMSLLGIVLLWPIASGSWVAPIGAQTSPTIVSTSVEHVDGTEPQMEHITLDARFQTNENILNAAVVQNRTGHDQELQNVGVDHSTTFQITLVVADYTPRNLKGTANDLRWERDFRDDNTVEVTIRATPMSQQMMDSHATFDDWPEGDDDRADRVTEEKVSFIIRSFDDHADDLKTSINGTIIGSDALSVGTPALRWDFEGRKRLVVRVGGPHYTVSGDVNRGVYYAVLAPPLLEEWNVEEPEQLETWYDGNATNFTTERLDDGSILIEMEPHYSVGTVAVAPADIPLLGWVLRGGLLLVVLLILWIGKRKLG